MDKIWASVCGLFLVLTVATLPGSADAQGESCQGKVVKMWQRNLDRSVDAVTRGYLNGKTIRDGLQEPLADVVAYSTYLVPCVQSMGKDWTSTMGLLINASQKEGLTGEEFAHHILLLQLGRAGAQLNEVKGFWEGRQFKVIP